MADHFEKTGLPGGLPGQGRGGCGLVVLSPDFSLESLGWCWGGGEILKASDAMAFPWPAQSEALGLGFLEWGVRDLLAPQVTPRHGQTEHLGFVPGSSF